MMTAVCACVCVRACCVYTMESLYKETHKLRTYMYL